MEYVSKFQIGFINVKSYNKRMISVENDMVTECNTILSENEIEMISVLHINSEFIDFMQSEYGNFSRQMFNVTIVRSDGEYYSVVGLN